MATPEQEAFIQEMMKKKPREVWQELWEARQKLAKASPFSGIHSSIKPLELEYDEDLVWNALPTEGGDTPMEYAISSVGLTHIRPVPEENADPFWFTNMLAWYSGTDPVDTVHVSHLIKKEGSLKGLLVSQVILDETHSFKELDEGDQVGVRTIKGDCTGRVSKVEERADGLYVTFEDGTTFHPAVSFKDQFDIDYPYPEPEFPPVIFNEKGDIYEKPPKAMTIGEARAKGLLPVGPTSEELLKEILKKKKHKVPKVKPLKNGTEMRRES